MSESTKSNTSKKVLAVLLLVFAALALNAVFFLEQEGATVCDKLVVSAQRYPGDDRPCLVRKYSEDGELESVVRFVFESDSLQRAVFDRDADGDFEDTIDCTFLGRVQIPIVKSEEWLSLVAYGVSRQEVQPIDYERIRRHEDGDHVVETFESTSAWKGPTLRREDRRDADGRLAERRFFREGTVGPTRELWMTYDSDGRLSSFERATELSSTVSMTRLQYDDCESVGD